MRRGRVTRKGGVAVHLPPSLDFHHFSSVGSSVAEAHQMMASGRISDYLTKRLFIENNVVC